MQYTLVRTRRRTLAVQIKPDGAVVVRAPFNMSERRIDAFLAEKSAWIKKHLSMINAEKSAPKYTDAEIKAFKISAKRVLTERTAYFAEIIGVKYGKITIRAERTLWGSCTARGNINLNCLLVELPQNIYDYVVIHELCHLKHLNHSRLFWETVAKYCPDYKIYRKWLKANGGKFLNRL